MTVPWVLRGSADDDSLLTLLICSTPSPGIMPKIVAIRWQYNGGIVTSNWFCVVK